MKLKNNYYILILIAMFSAIFLLDSYLDNSETKEENALHSDSLMSKSEITKAQNIIKNKTLNEDESRILDNEEFGKFINDKSLSNEEVELLFRYFDTLPQPSSKMMKNE